MHRKNIETQSLSLRSCIYTPMNILNYFLCPSTVSKPTHKTRPNIDVFVPLYDHLSPLVYHYEIAKTQFSESAIGK